MNQFPLQQHFSGASRLIFGCMGLGGQWDERHLPLIREDTLTAHAAIDAALEGGITMFDHADIYTGGKAEKVFGQVLKEKAGLREQLILQSKCGIRFEDAEGPGRYDLSGSWISQSVDNILERLGTDYLDILLLHRPDPLMEAEEIAETFEKLNKSGKVRQFGVSNMHQHQIRYLQSCLDQPLVTNQLNLSLGQTDWLDEGVMVANPNGKDLNFTPGTFEYCRQHNIQVQSWGSLAQGLFSGKDLSDAPEYVRQTGALVQTLANQYGTSCEAIVLAWLMRHPANIQPVIGTSRPGRIRACAQAEEIQLTRDDWYKLYVLARGESLP